MQMLFKAPGPHFCDGSMVDYVVVPLDMVDATVALGWFLTMPEALAAAEKAAKPEPDDEVPADDAPVTRAELEAKATELGLKFDGRTSDAKLLAKIDEALKG